jgi:peroxiredoxin
MLGLAAFLFAAAVGAQGVAVGKPPPPFALMDDRGQTVAWEQLRGRPTVLYFTHNACFYCTQIIGFLKRMDERYRTEGLQIVGINIMAKDTKLLVAYKRDLGFSFPLLAGNTPEILKPYRISYVPVLVFVDREGIVRQVVGHFILEPDLEKAIQSILRPGKVSGGQGGAK